MNNNDGYTNLCDWTFNRANYINKWVHFSFNIDIQTEGTVNFYIDGVIQTKLSKVGNWILVYPTTIEDFVLFNIPTLTTQGFIGYIDDFRIYNKLLTTDEISRLIGEVERLPLIHYKFQNNLTDTSGNTTLSLDNGTIEYNQDITKNAEYSLKQNTGILTITNNNIIAGLNKFNLGFWINIYQDTNSNQVIMYKASSFLFMYSQPNKLLLKLGTLGNHEWSFNLSNYLNKWTYISLSCDLSTSSVKLYINGLLQTPSTVGGYLSTLPSNTNDLSLFCNSNSGGGFVKAYVNDFRFYDKDLSAEEIRTIMYNNTNLLLWYKFEDDFNDTTNKTIITTNTAILSPSPEH